MRPDPSLFKLWHPVHVRFKDVDIGGHVHHSNVLVYFEEARAEYWRRVVGKDDMEAVDFIMGEARVRYHGRILYPSRLQVGARVSLLGKKHFVMEYLARDEEGRDLASGETTMVMFDYQARRTKAIDPQVRTAVEGHEGEFLGG